ncbi:hypothetical protein [Pseudodesulfovibrio sediminis]|uniref:Uncharacterized protein n=1 Tax=Pseudodesulfovibrio sediminis TaxID=2810563 RepID=A0ABM7PAK3_9BACT|nr:hypothetical protein [Pseudodesulfovibrio sediminis]BCS90128.1 hypothetical protein PSDVSF_33700 [Pseudodesulfovibrio sediminis]
MDETKPYLTEDGTLIIPFECADNTYKYWKQEGRDITEILTELNASPEVWARYTHKKFPDTQE